ncbi:MAG TPA: TIGR03617 family F420-dependent LLM class oxidoreductase [Acidimicrobiales bacterium]|nr:TIGR03617 family F420-dependent LLM class oxidoreductase [Acidimicrobiales bacterium]
MQLDVMTSGGELRSVQHLAQDVARAGLDGLVVTEAGRTAYLSCAAAALAADVDILTGIAVAFPRSPMVTAQIAWELAEASGGRFRLGIGTQVRAHTERRYSAAFAPPGPRLREYVEAVRACFRAFRGDERLGFDGRWWQMSLLPSQWSPGAIGVPDPPVDVAAVNPWMLRMAGEVADGVHVHPLNTVTYLQETVLPNVTAAGRRPQLIVPAFTAFGDTDHERHRWREMARMQVAFYGSTPNYAFIFEQLGYEGLTARIREKQKAGDIPGMASAVGDDVLAHFLTEGSWTEAGRRLVERYNGVADRVVLYFAGMAWAEDRGAIERWADVATELHAASSHG